MLAGLLLLLAAMYFLDVRPASRRERRDATVLLRAEELKLSKTREQLADVTTRKEVVRELQTVTVPVTKEELVVEKDGVEAVRIPIRADQVAVSTRSVPLNDVSVYRQEWAENQQIQVDLKKEVARIEATGDAKYSEGAP